MPVLKTLADDNLKARFRAIACERGISESEFLRYVAMAAVGLADSSRPAELIEFAEAGAPGAQLDRMTVWAPAYILDAARTRGEAVGMAGSRWIAGLVQSNVTRLPVLTDAEVQALEASDRQLSAIGRNLNQIARALNNAFHETERVKLEKLAELAAAVADNRAAIDALIRASRNKWGAGGWR